MCKSLCTYRKFISVDNHGYYNCDENPHIILSAHEYSNGSMTYLNPIMNAANNLYSTNFHKFYLDILEAWTTQIQNAANVTASFVATPQFATLTQTGFLTGDMPTMPVNNALNIAENYNTYTITNAALISGLINYSKPPFDFAENIAASEYVPAFIYDQGELGFSTGGDPIILVEFLDVNGSHCKGA